MTSVILSRDKITQTSCEYHPLFPSVIVLM